MNIAVFAAKIHTNCHVLLPACCTELSKLLCTCDLCDDRLLLLKLQCNFKLCNLCNCINMYRMISYQMIVNWLQCMIIHFEEYVE